MRKSTATRKRQPRYPTRIIQRSPGYKVGIYHGESDEELNRAFEKACSMWAAARMAISVKNIQDAADETDLSGLDIRVADAT